MNETRSIFRPVAVARYQERRERVVLPRPIAASTITLLWLALALVLAMAIGAVATGARWLLPLAPSPSTTEPPR